MASSWIVARATKPDGRYRGKPRYRVIYRLHGAGSPHHYGGSFPTKAEALERKRWIDGELAARRIPDLAELVDDAVRPVADALDLLVGGGALRFHGVSVESGLWQDSNRYAALRWLSPL